MKEVLLEFKQQPQEKYVYRITDRVEGEIQSVDGHRYTYLHEQEQKSEMTIAAIDSAAVRELALVLVVTKDTVINAPELAWQRRRGSIVGKIFEYRLRMHKNGEIIEVKSNDPKVTFFFDSSYKPSQPVFPDRSISPADIWTQNFPVEVPGGAPTVATTQYHFHGFTRLAQFDCAVIDFKGELEFTESHESPDKTPDKFIVKKNHAQMTSEGQIFFAYREGFMVKKVNLITSTMRTTTFTTDKVEMPSQAIFKDHEKITLVEIHRPGGDVGHYRIP
ncbi:MAG: hypothetical protein ONB44_22445 [candidate division KSB1 bacterium]|nr:hypothetical protein [candidate division KSB1 bacterium]MDZ7304898.1 hypothetical protein [candidate division KSB1 bacterium]MDZ7313966.1 hypothetical protein [candidate division KSB1 bacterium]